jgi:hypothetical protein
MDSRFAFYDWQSKIVWPRACFTPKSNKNCVFLMCQVIEKQVEQSFDHAIIESFWY